MEVLLDEQSLHSFSWIKRTDEALTLWHSTKCMVQPEKTGNLNGHHYLEALADTLI
jgi:hypothetical protein